MQNRLRKLLDSAEGHSHHVVVMFLDIRGFSSFAKIAESSDAAEFLRSAYLKLLDDHVKDADFVKLTGDGMLALFRYHRESLRETVRVVVDVSLRLVDEWPTVCKDDPMVNFDVPQELGIGLARGAATALTSGRTVLDYSGRPLNLAARLMDLARPSGVVFDQSLGFDLLEDDVRALFAEDGVYVKGIAEETPISVYYQRVRTEIPEGNRLPMNRFRRYSDDMETMTFREFQERKLYRHKLAKEPSGTDDVTIYVSHPSVTGSGAKHPTMKSTRTVPAQYQHFMGDHIALINYSELAAEMKRRGVKQTWPIEVTCEYSVRDDQGGPDGK